MGASKYGRKKKATTVHFSADLPNLPRAKTLTSLCQNARSLLNFVSSFDNVVD